MYTMIYSKSTKKYSHCQSETGVASAGQGFFLVEFMYTFFIVTMFMVIISLFIGLSIQWAQITSNRLLALALARNQLEGLWLESSRKGSVPVAHKDGVFAIETHHEEKRVGPGMRVRHHWVTVTWDDARGNTHTVLLETYA